MPTLLSEECAQILGCRVKSLRDHLNHPMKRTQLLKELLAKKIRTTYKDKNGFTQTFYFGGITNQGADQLMAYGNLSRLFNITVCQHFYARHRIRLQNPYLPCVVQHFPPSGEDRFYPLELLELVEEDEDNTQDDLEFRLKQHEAQARHWMAMANLCRGTMQEQEPIKEEEPTEGTETMTTTTETSAQNETSDDLLLQNPTATDTEVEMNPINNDQEPQSSKIILDSPPKASTHSWVDDVDE